MSPEFRLPQLGHAQEVTIGRWLRKPGEPVTAGQKLLEASSDEADWDVPGPIDGTLRAIEVPVGAHVTANTVLALIAAAETAAGSPREQLPLALEPQKPFSPQQNHGAAPHVSPLAARIALNEGVDLSQVAGSGVDGRVTKEDVLAFTRRQTASPASAGPAGDNLVELSVARRAASTLAAQSKQSVPHVSTFVEVDMTNVVRQQEALRDAWQRREGFVAGSVPFVLLAVVAALREAPVINGLFAPNGIIYRKAFHIAVLIPTVPHALTFILRDAEIYNLLGIARRLQPVESGASAEPDGTTFAIEDRSAGGALLTTTIIGEGHSARLAMGVLHPRAVAAEIGMRIRVMAWFSLTYDHRLVDGLVAGRFLSALKQQLESASSG
jgi:pyruvate/2-oxoglutarate dehydrogenase complex dihydrolipoamide acyltransferase (E2) component